jgi:hypothetical protein
MNHRSTQFGVRENTASSRRHASRHAVDCHSKPVSVEEQIPQTLPSHFPHVLHATLQSATAEEERLLGSTWFESPVKAVEAREAQARSIAQAAAESNWDDRNLGALAKREREALDAASETHVTEVPRTPIKRSHNKHRGRPRKVGIPPEEAEVTT